MFPDSSPESSEPIALATGAVALVVSVEAERHLESGDLPSARAAATRAIDLIRATQFAPQSPGADIARKALARLDAGR